MVLYLLNNTWTPSSNNPLNQRNTNNSFWCFYRVNILLEFLVKLFFWDWRGDLNGSWSNVISSSVVGRVRAEFMIRAWNVTSYLRSHNHTNQCVMLMILLVPSSIIYWKIYKLYTVIQYTHSLFRWNWYGVWSTKILRIMRKVLLFWTKNNSINTIWSRDHLCLVMSNLLSHYHYLLAFIWVSSDKCLLQIINVLIY